MSKDFDVVFPSRGRVPLIGGLNNKADRHEIDNTESPDCLNVVFGDRTVETRGGTDKLNTASVGSFVGDGLYTRHGNDDSQTMCAWWNGTMYTLGTTTFTTVPSAQSVFTGGVRVGAAEYENHLFFGNGGNDPYKYNGTDFTLHGIKTPSAPTAATAATGTALTGEYRYKVTYVNSQAVEGNPSTFSTTFTAATENISVTIPTAPASHGVDARRLYRTVSSGATFLRVAEISNNTATTYEDAIADGSLGVSPPTDAGEPPKYEFIETHDNRLFCNSTVDRNFLWYSDLAEPYTFASTNFLRVGDNSGEIITGLSKYDNSLIVFCRNSTWLVHMGSTSPTDWRSIEIRSFYGSKSPFGAFKYNDKVMFPAVDKDKIAGFAAVRGLSVDADTTFLTVGSIGSLLKSERIEPEVIDFTEGTEKNISSITYQNRAYITLTKGSGETENNRIYLFDFSLGNMLERKKEGVWVPWTGINAAQFAEYNGNLYYISSTGNGHVYQMNTTTFNDDSTAINSYIWSKNFSGVPGDEQEFKDFRSFGFLFEKSGDFNMDVSYRTDSDKGVGTAITIDLDPGGSLWGSMIWGTDNWGGGNDEGETELYLGQIRGKRIQFKISNQNIINQKFKILGINFGYNRKGRR